VAGVKRELEDLRNEWEEYKKPISEQIFEQKQEIQDKRVEYQFKADKIKGIKREIKLVEEYTESHLKITLIR
jgi:hypothetical protein